VSEHRWGEVEEHTSIRTRRHFPWRLVWRVCWILVLGLVAVYVLYVLIAFIVVMP